MAARGIHAVNESAIVTEQQQASRILIQPAHSLHAAGPATLGGRALPQHGRQQGINAGPGAGTLRTLIARWLVKHEIRRTAALPRLPLHGNAQALRRKNSRRISANAALHLHQPLRNQPRALTARAKTLGKKKVMLTCLFV